MSERSQPEFIEGLCRNEQDAVRSHLYRVESDGSYLPMCGYGWNRSDGKGFSIFRGHQSLRGTCKICIRNVDAGKEPVHDGWPHPTKWI